MVWNITRPENVGDDKNVYGLELAMQHLIGETGFGVGVNGTWVEGDVEYGQRYAFVIAFSKL